VSRVDLFSLMNAAKLKGDCRDKVGFNLTGGVSGVVPGMKW